MKDLNRLNYSLVLLLILNVTTFSVVNAQPPIKSIQGFTNAGIETRVNEIFSKMTLDDKILLLSGNEMEMIPNPRIGIPKIRFADGPVWFTDLGKCNSFSSACLYGINVEQ